MSKNVGKIFEESIKNAIPPYCLYHRLNDSATSFNGGTASRFTIKNPFDCMLFDNKARIFYALELKSTKSKSMSFEDISVEGKQPTKMIHKHQILGLLDVAKYSNAEAGFLFNFRDEDNGTEKTYYQEIHDFTKMCENIGKKSFNEKDLIEYNGYKMLGTKKIKKYSWDMIDLLNMVTKKHN